MPILGACRDAKILRVSSRHRVLPGLGILSKATLTVCMELNRWTDGNLYQEGLQVVGVEMVKLLDSR